MNRPIFVCAMLLISAAGLEAQNASQANPYQGISTPPPDSSILTTANSQAKPPAGQLVMPAEEQTQPVQAAPAINNTDPDGGIVAVQPNASEPNEPKLLEHDYASDPDGDIVHPHPLRPGELPEGATIRVELLDLLSTAGSEKGEAFRSRVASDVLLGGQVLIPAGAEIDGRVASVSIGRPGGRGSMLLRPETVILADGTRYQLHAYITQTPGSHSRIGSEGTVLPASRMKRDGIEYGSVVGAGATTGAIVGGPVGALTGGLIGAGIVTAHLLISHPQATLEVGTVLVFTLSEPLQMAPAVASGN